MKNYFTIFKLLFKYMFKRSGEKSNKVLWLAYAFIGLVFGGMIAFMCYYVSLFAQALTAMDLLPEFLTLIMGAACVMVLLFGLIPMLSYLYFSRDTEFMMTLPVAPSTVYMAKLTVVYLTEIVISTLVLLPCMITIGVTLSLGPVFYIVAILSVPLVPAIPLLLISIIAIPLMYIVSFFRNKGALTSIALILLFGIIFGGYYLVILDIMPSSEDIPVDQIVASLSGMLLTLSKILFPFAAVMRLATLSPRTMFGNFSVGASAAINLAVFVVTSILCVALGVLVSALIYRRGARSVLEGSRKTNEGKIEFKEEGSAFSAIFKKEWRELVRTPAFAFQSLSGLLLAPIIVFFMSRSFSVELFAPTVDGEAPSPETIAMLKSVLGFMIVGMVGMVGISINVGAATTITREGKNFYFSKMIPVPYRAQIQAKLLLYVIISSLTIVFAMVTFAFAWTDVVMLVFGSVFLLVYNYGFNCFCIYFDLCRPKLNWTTPNEAVKNNRSAVVPTFINMAMFLVIIVLAVVCTLNIASPIIAAVVVWAILMLIGTAAAIVFHCLLFTNVNYLYDRING